jgi:hypothetical protein
MVSLHHRDVSTKVKTSTMHTANTQQISQKLGDKMSNFNFKNCTSIIVVHYIVLQSIKETAKKNLILRVTSLD